MFAKLGRKLLFSIGLGAFVFLFLSVVTDLDRLRMSFERFDLVYAWAALGLALVNYLLRFFRWHLYLKVLDIPLKWGDSLLVFLGGLVLSVTPGKAGELLKAYFVRYRLGTPVSQTAPAILAERLTDFISLIFLAFLGIFSFQKGLLPLVVGLCGIALLILVLGRPRAMAFCLRWAGRLPGGGRLAEPLARAYEGMRLLVAPLNLLWAVGLGVLAWFAECFGFYAVLVGFGAGVGAVQATFIYSFSTLFGALTMLPGGLGPTEGSMSGLLVLQGVPLPDAVGGTFVIRVCTLWFAVALGAGVLLRFRNRFEWEIEEEPGERQGV